MSLVSLKTELRQELKLTPQLLQSMEVLQMNVQDLAEYLSRASEENPLLEAESPASLQNAYAQLRRAASWLDAGPQGGTFLHEDGTVPERSAADRETESLAAFLRDQLERRHLEKPLLALCTYLAELVDEDGYLAPEDLESLEELKLPQELTDRALTELQSLDPPGVGARDLAECLVLQLRRQGACQVSIDIAAQFLPELGRKHYGPIARALGITVEEVQAAEKIIAGLDPHPGRAFEPAEPTVYVQPDVFIVELEGQLKVVLNDYYLPRMSISTYYARLLKESDDAKTRTYLREKMQQAKWLLGSLERRGNTLRQCAEAILEAQRPFFTGESTELSPMRLSALANQLGVHPSTVSRTARGKYLQCRQGTYPLRYFFSLAVGASGPSRQAVKHRLLELVQKEDPRHPLSDQKLSQLLSTQGVQVARRTVAKYRLELGIGSSTARKWA